MIYIGLADRNLEATHTHKAPSTIEVACTDAHVFITPPTTVR